MTLFDDGKDVEVKTLHKSIFPKGTKGKVVDCQFVGGTTERIYLFQTYEHIHGLVDGLKTAWYFDRDLVNIIDK